MREGDAVKPIVITRGILIQWEEFAYFTIEVEAPSDEARSDLLDAMRDRKKVKITIEVEE